ncbi:MAG: hypothetical protein M0R06_20700 [Sphaerochaeta sp.]|jgi:hypothetical protein|nr:hypothetical protein [Sphaerochaeta sp.]
MPIVEFSRLRESLNAPTGIINSIGPYCILDGEKSNTELLLEIERTLEKGIERMRGNDCGGHRNNIRP